MIRTRIRTNYRMTGNPAQPLDKKAIRKIHLECISLALLALSVPVIVFIAVYLCEKL
jgi:hypothetical protein